MWAFERKAFLEYEELDAARRDALIENAMDLEVDDVEVKDMKEEPRKAYSPMLVRPGGSSIDVNEEQREKA